MLAHFDNLLRQLLISRVPTITDEAQVRFQPPDEDWRTYVSTLSVGGNPANALNVYLVDVRENRKFVPDFFKVTPRCPHGALVLSNTAASGQIWFGRGREPAGIDEFVVVGPSIQKWGRA